MATYPIPLPNKIYFASEEKFKSEVVIEPLYPGYGVTIGNALRRVLLSSLPGAAVTAVKIRGVDHEFSTVPNAKEDVVDIILNLKQLRLRILQGDEPQIRLELKAKGQKEVRACDIQPDSRVEIINSDLLIATLDNKNAELSLEIFVEQGRGYVPVEIREREKPEIGVISIDAVFTPIRSVNFRVENVRVGQITNFEKLTLNIETDGTISGREALDLTSQILIEHFSLLKTSELLEAKPEIAESQAGTEGPVPAVPTSPEMKGDLESLNFGKRAYNALTRKGIVTVAELKGLTREDLENIEGLGEKSIKEILEALERLNEAS
jgi:DNA-directed RNA polymerase subunit alpha